MFNFPARFYIQCLYRTATFSILLFQVSFAYDLEDIAILEVAYGDKKEKNNNSEI